MNTWTFILSLATCTGSLSAQPQTFKSATVGSTVVLPCDWKEIFSRQLTSQSPHVEWRTFAETVFERMGGELYQAEGYEGRVDVPEDNLQKGNCSLVLKNVRSADEGLYESYLLVRRSKRSLGSKRVLIQSVELSIYDAPKETYSEDKAAEDKNLRRIGSNLSSNAEMIHTFSQTFMFFLLTNILFQII